MPNFDIVVKTDPPKSFRVEAIKGTYDLNEDSMVQQFKGSIDLSNEWQIGLIVGKSGTGKSTIAKKLFGDILINEYTYQSYAVVDDMPDTVSVQDICKTFNSVGFSSPPSWLKPYNVLSNGEKMRVNLARALLTDHEIFAFDEFTSVVDRNVAQIGSFAMQKAIRKTRKKFIAITCHFDVEDWLLPDWVFNTDDMTFQSFEGQKKNRPKLKFEMFRTKKKSEYWRMFAKYHYLSHSLNKAAHVYIGTINDDVFGFSSVLPFPHPKIKNHWKEHRTVVLPDYQGIGLGHILSNSVAELYHSNGKTFLSVSSHPALIHARSKDPKWIIKSIGRKSKGSKGGKIHNKYISGASSNNRITASFKYIG